MPLRILAVVVLFAACLSANAQEDKQIKKARKELAEAKKNLMEAKMDSTLDYAAFVKDAQQEIDKNKKEIAALKSKKATLNEEIDEKYAKKLINLGKENDVLEERIKNSEHTKSSMWKRFKASFKRDMEKLGQSIRRI